MCDNEIIDLKYCKKSYTVLDLDPVGLSRNLHYTYSQTAKLTNNSKKTWVKCPIIPSPVYIYVFMIRTPK